MYSSPTPPCFLLYLSLSLSPSLYTSLLYLSLPLPPTFSLFLTPFISLFLFISTFSLYLSPSLTYLFLTFISSPILSYIPNLFLTYLFLSFPRLLLNISHSIFLFSPDSISLPSPRILSFPLSPFTLSILVSFYLSYQPHSFKFFAL